jgi:hypothetical protein
MSSFGAMAEFQKSSSQCESLFADFWVELKDATVSQKGTSGKLTAKDFAIP